jgi:hypothetical protein
VQASFGALKEPEQLHPVNDVHRMTVSVTHGISFQRGSWSTTFAWGQNDRPETIISLGEARARLPGPLLSHYLNVGSLPPNADDTLLLRLARRDQAAWLIETAARWRGSTGFMRYERAMKDELFALPDLRHSTSYRVEKLDFGIVQDVVGVGPLGVGLGASASVHFIADELVSEYGDGLWSSMLFLRVML